MSNMIDGTKRTCMQFKDVRSFLDSILAEDIHAKRVDSLANAALGVMTGASLAVAMIGKSLAQARGLLPKHAIKQVDRLLRARFESVRALRSPLHIPPLSYFCRGRTHELCCKFASVHAELILSSHLH